MDEFSLAAASIDMPAVGCHNELGLVSFDRNEKPKLYAHFVEKEDKQTAVFISVGLSYLKDRNDSERPDSAIHRLINEVENL